MCIGIPECSDTMSLPHTEEFEQFGDKGFHAQTDTNTDSFTVDLSMKNLVCGNNLQSLILIEEILLNLNSSLEWGLQIWHSDIVNVQKYQNAVMVRWEVRIG